MGRARVLEPLQKRLNMLRKTKFVECALMGFCGDEGGAWSKFGGKRLVAPRAKLSTRRLVVRRRALAVGPRAWWWWLERVEQPARGFCAEFSGGGRLEGSPTATPPFQCC